MKEKGKFIVLYGVNNLGKTTQAKLLVKKFQENGLKAENIKYPIYNLEPAGKLINDYLRKSNKENFSPREFQLLHYIDRVSFEPILKEKLNKGINVIAEDYFGTAIAWGIETGVREKFLEYLYSFLYKEDLSFLFDGERFVKAIEKKHKHETNAELVEKVRQRHLKLAEKYQWEIIKANLSIEKIHNIIWRKIKTKFNF